MKTREKAYLEINQPKKNYDVFAMASSEVHDGAEMVMLTFNDNSETGIEEIKLDPEDLELAQLTAECMFLTGHLGWKEGLDHGSRWDNWVGRRTSLKRGQGRQYLLFGSC